jgi:hypothetical protein
LKAILDVPEMAGVREQFLDIAAEGRPDISLGGLGGAAPGAGGGGGGAIGTNAFGGKGGSGGDTILLDGAAGTAPGAGGGGAGVIGDGAVAGDGGGGGQFLTVTLGPDDLKDIHHFEIQVGKGGVNGPGEDTIVNLVNERGEVRRQLIAEGGKEGSPPILPPKGREPTVADLEAGLTVTSIIVAEFIRFRDGVWTIVCGGWDWVSTNTSPFRLPLPMFVEIGTGTIDPQTLLQLRLVVLTPTGFQTSELRQAITVEDSLVRKSRFLVTLELAGSHAGIWRVLVYAGDKVIGELPIEVRLPEMR